MKNELRGYSIWLLPDEKSTTLLRRIVDDYSQKLGTPTFEPHLTLLGGVQLAEADFVEKSERLASELRPFEITIDDVSFSSTYWQCVFAAAKQSAALLAAHMKALEIFEIEKPVFMPHISLVYGEFDAYTREKIAQQITLPQLTFTAAQLAVTPSVPNPADWKHVAEIPFG